MGLSYSSVIFKFFNCFFLCRSSTVVPVGKNNRTPPLFNRGFTFKINILGLISSFIVLHELWNYSEWDESKICNRIRLEDFLFLLHSFLLIELALRGLELKVRYFSKDILPNDELLWTIWNDALRLAMSQTTLNSTPRKPIYGSWSLGDIDEVDHLIEGQRERGRVFWNAYFTKYSSRKMTSMHSVNTSYMSFINLMVEVVTTI